MSVFRKIDKVLAAFGNIRALERTHVDTYTEDLIKNVPGKKYAESKEGQFWGEFNTLNGYHFFECTILSRQNIKTWNGGVLHLKTSEQNLEISTDNTEIESDYSNVSNTWMTKVSFILEKKELNAIKNEKVINLEFLWKKKKIVMYGLK
ncbi:hypothetical protein [Croceivirga thetidis]|uniref:Uncharacterized protein n=1 Tax=Croceivirga thetidis TaxID=2721623 RepID=A0ABX1GXS6_9FLAO|nr:hypothetical protein [Croceivirga thetidis]NKI33477.1 hypothetical protein [Croceivirga thetidis]